MRMKASIAVKGQRSRMMACRVIYEYILMQGVQLISGY